MAWVCDCLGKTAVLGRRTIGSLAGGSAALRCWRHGALYWISQFHCAGGAFLRRHGTFCMQLIRTARPRSCYACLRLTDETR